MQELIKKGYEVHIAAPQAERADDFIAFGCKFIPINIDRRGTNPIKDMGLFLKFAKIIKSVKPGVILTYTVKPNMYGAVCAKLFRIPVLANITGLGTGINSKNIVGRLLRFLYKLALNSQRCIFAQNESIRAFLEENKIKAKKTVLIPGSGVNVNHYSLLDYPEGDTIDFFFIARVMKEKGIEEYIQAAKHFTSLRKDVRFHIFGRCEEAYTERLAQLQDEGVLIYHGLCRNLIEEHKYNCCTIQASYHEGMSNVILESASCGRPCLCSDIPGCREAVNDGKTGFLFKSQSADSLIEAIDKFLKISVEERKEMGIAAREKMINEFNRQLVIDAYMTEIDAIAAEKGSK